MNTHNAAEICAPLAPYTPKNTTALDSDLGLKNCLNHILNNFPAATYKIAIIVAREATDSQAIYDYLNGILEEIKNG